MEYNELLKLTLGPAERFVQDMEKLLTPPKQYPIELFREIPEARVRFLMPGPGLGYAYFEGTEPLMIEDMVPFLFAWEMVEETESEPWPEDLKTRCEQYKAQKIKEFGLNKKQKDADKEKAKTGMRNSIRQELDQARNKYGEIGSLKRPGNTYRKTFDLLNIKAGLDIYISQLNDKTYIITDIHSRISLLIDQLTELIRNLSLLNPNEHFKNTINHGILLNGELLIDIKLVLEGIEELKDFLFQFKDSLPVATAMLLAFMEQEKLSFNNTTIKKLAKSRTDPSKIDNLTNRKKGNTVKDIFDWLNDECQYPWSKTEQITRDNTEMEVPYVRLNRQTAQTWLTHFNLADEILKKKGYFNNMESNREQKRLWIKAINKLNDISKPQKN